MSLLQLPQELLEQVLGELDSCEIAALSTTSKALACSAERLLYKKVVFDAKNDYPARISRALNGLARMSRLASTALRRPNLALLIHELHIMLPRDLYASSEQQHRLIRKEDRKTIRKCIADRDGLHQSTKSQLVELLRSRPLQACTVLLILACTALKRLKLADMTLDDYRLGSDDTPVSGLAVSVLGKILAGNCELEYVDVVAPFDEPQRRSFRLSKPAIPLESRMVFGLFSLPKVEHLKVKICQQTRENWWRVRPQLSFPKLRSLYLTHSELSTVEVGHLLRCTPNLETLTLHLIKNASPSGNILSTWYSLPPLGDKIRQHCGKLKSLSISTRFYIHRDDSVQSTADPRGAWGTEGRIGSLKSLGHLERLSIDPSVLFGSPLVPQGGLASLIPGSVEQLEFLDEVPEYSNSSRRLRLYLSTLLACLRVPSKGLKLKRLIAPWPSQALERWCAAESVNLEILTERQPVVLAHQNRQMMAV